MSANMRYIECVHYTFNRDLDIAYAIPDPPARPSHCHGDWLPPLIGVLDQEALLRLCALDPSGRSEVAIMVLRAFECSAQRWRRRLQIAASDEAARPVDVVSTVQMFKSAAAIVGAPRLSRLCAEAERLAQGRRSRDLDVVIDAIIAESGRILAVLAPLRRR